MRSNDSSFARSDEPAPSLKFMGWLSVVTGTGLAAAMVGIAYILHGVVTGGGSGGHPRWTGGPEFTRLVFELFGAVFLFGSTAVAAGIFQLRRNRQNRGLAALMFGLLAVMFYLGYRVLTASSAR